MTPDTTTTKMPIQEVRDRLERIKRYNKHHQRLGQPQHCLTQKQLDQEMQKWGADQRLAKGIGYVPPPSEILSRIEQTAQPVDF